MKFRNLLILILLLALVGGVFGLWYRWQWVLNNQDLAVGFITAYILLITLVGALLSLRQMWHDRAVSLVMNFWTKYDSTELMEARALVYDIRNTQSDKSVKEQGIYLASVINDYKLNATDKFVKLLAIPGLFDGISWLVRKKCCDAQEIDELLDWETYYQLWEPFIRERQEKTQDQSLDDSPCAFYGNFVWLAKKLPK